MKNVLATIAGIMDAFILTFVFDIVAHVAYPTEIDFSTLSTQEIKLHIDSIPQEQFYIMSIGHFLAAAVGMGLASIISKTSKTPAIIVGALMLLATLFNLFAIPHPLTFLIMDITALILGLSLGWLITSKLVKQK